MAIDGIGKPPGIGGPTGPTGSTPTGQVARGREAFKVEKVGSASDVQSTDALARLERGEIDVNQYLDARVEQAVEHLRGKLSAEQIEFVQSSLREQLQSDPVLLELVRRSTGGARAE
jgi:hypothetical protein